MFGLIALHRTEAVLFINTWLNLRELPLDHVGVPSSLNPAFGRICTIQDNPDFRPGNLRAADEWGAGSASAL